MLHRISTQIGQTEIDNGRVSDAVAGYFRAAGIEPPRSPPLPYWGGALMAWAAIQDGITPPVGAIDAIAWLAWGSQLAAPVPGCIVITTAGSGASRMMIGVAASVQGRKVHVIAAHDGSVQARHVDLGQVISARRPPNMIAALPVAPLVQSAPLMIEGTAVAVQAPPPLPAPVPIASPPTDPDAPTVTPEALQRLLAHIQGEFASIHSDIATIKQHAIASVSISEAP